MAVAMHETRASGHFPLRETRPDEQGEGQGQGQAARLQGLAGTCGALHVACNLSTSRLDQLGKEGIFLLTS